MVLLGCSAILSNGFAVAERGTSQVALVASASNIPVLVAAQTCKFVDRVNRSLLAFSFLQFHLGYGTQPWGFQRLGSLFHLDTLWIPLRIEIEADDCSNFFFFFCFLLPMGYAELRVVENRVEVLNFAKKSIRISFLGLHQTARRELPCKLLNRIQMISCILRCSHFPVAFMKSVHWSAKGRKRCQPIW